VIYNEGYPTDGLNLGRLFAEKVETDAQVYLSTATEAVVLKELGAEANGMLLSSSPNAEVKGIPDEFNEFQSAFKEQFPDATYNNSAIVGYTAMSFVIEAIKAAGCAEPEAVATALHDVTLTHDTGNLYPQDELSFAENGSLENPPAFFAQVQDGKAVIVYPENLAEGEPIPFR
jgi:ABC-type branched-subunit amino acid transport system substrate-binding protein